MSIPSTIIWMCSGVPLTSRYDHTLYFSSIAEQNEYFNSKVSKTLMTYSYVRRTWKLKVQAHQDEARMWSYLFFKNGTSGKRYYYFINHVEYINDNTVELSLELDVLQTYLFDWTLRECYIERAHSVTDTIGANKIDEGLDVGEYLTSNTNVTGLNELVIITASTIDLNKFYFSSGETVDNILGSKYDGIFGGFQLTATYLNDWWDEFSVMLNYLNTKGKTDAVFTMWLYPKELIESDYGTYEWTFMEYVKKSKSKTITVTGRPSTLNGYTPKNNKLLQYPYCYMYATNNNGLAAVYPYEYFRSGTRFIVEGNIAPDSVVRLTPIDYKGQLFNYDESLTMSNFPLCSWNNDTYKMWLAQNQNQQNLSFAMSGLKIIGGAAAIVGGVAATGGTGGAAGAVGFAGVSSGVSLITSGASDIAGQLAQRADKEIQPPQARGTYSGSHNITRGLQDFYIHHKTIDAYHAKMIDDYFTMYGYAMRQVGTPNIKARPAFTYIKTIGSNVTGNFCQEDLQVINSIFDKGVTFWADTANVGNYSVDNSP